MGETKERDKCGYCRKRFSVTVKSRQLVCVTPKCPARQLDFDGGEYTGEIVPEEWPDDDEDDDGEF